MSELQRIFEKLEDLDRRVQGIDRSMSEFHASQKQICQAATERRENMHAALFHPQTGLCTRVIRAEEQVSKINDQLKHAWAGVVALGGVIVQGAWSYLGGGK